MRPARPSRLLPFTLTAALGVALLLVPAPARAHCDTLDGPVVADARVALGAGDATPVLKWVSAKQEAELRDAFQQTLAVRKLGSEAQALADTFFFETLVRLHRDSEGAPYTGVKPGGKQPPFIGKVETALTSGSIDDFARLVSEHAASGVKVRFQKAVEARKSQGKSVAEGRAYVAAYVELMHYVEGVVEAVHKQGHAHGADSPSPGAAGHEH